MIQKSKTISQNVFQKTASDCRIFGWIKILCILCILNTDPHSAIPIIRMISSFFGHCGSGCRLHQKKRKTKSISYSKTENLRWSSLSSLKKNMSILYNSWKEIPPPSQRSGYTANGSESGYTANGYDTQPTDTIHSQRIRYTANGSGYTANGSGYTSNGYDTQPTDPDTSHNTKRGLINARQLIVSLKQYFFIQIRVGGREDTFLNVGDKYKYNIPLWHWTSTKDPSALHSGTKMGIPDLLLVMMAVRRSSRHRDSTAQTTTTF
jgi:hypothetical protein